MIKLVLERKDKAPVVWVCADDTFLIGRGVEPPNWQLPYPDVSRKHLRFSVHGGQVFVEGLSERSPAYLNKRRIHGLTQISKGDEIRIGYCRLRVVGTPEDMRPKPPPPKSSKPTTPSGTPVATGNAQEQNNASAPSESEPPKPVEKQDPPPIFQLADLSDIVQKAKDWRDLDKPPAALMDRQMLRRGLAWKKRGTPDLGADNALVRLYIDTSREYRRLDWIRRGLTAATVVFAVLGGYTLAQFLSDEVVIQDKGSEDSEQCKPEETKRAKKLLEIAKQQSASDRLLLAGLAYTTAQESHCKTDYGIEEAVREVMSGHPGSVLGTHKRAVTSVVIAPNGHYIASLDSEGQLKLWDRGGREMLAPADTGHLLAIAWSADSEMLASGDDGGSLKLWSIVDSGDRNQPIKLSLTKTLDDQRQEIAGLAFSSGGEYLASIDRSGKVRLWDTGGEATGDALGSGRIHPGPSSGPPPLLVFDGGGKRLFGHWGGEVQIWQLDRKSERRLSDQRRQRLPTEHTITSVAVHRDGDRLLTGDAEGLVLLWSLKGARKGTKFSPRRLNQGEPNAISQVAFVPTKNSALYTTSRGDLFRISTETRRRRGAGAPSYRLSSGLGDVQALLVDPSGQRALTVSTTSGRQLWDLENDSRRHLRKLDEGGPPWNEARVVPDNSMIISGDADGRVMAWNLLAERSDAGAWSLSEQRGRIDALAQPPATEDLPTFFTASRDNTIREWEYRKGQPLTVRTIATETSVKHLEVSQHHIVGAAKGRLWIWDRGPSEKPKPLIELSAGRPIRHLGLSRETGDWLVSIDETNRMRSWHIGKHLRRQPDQEMTIDGTVRSLVVLRERAFVATHNGNSSEVFSWDLNADKPSQETIDSGGPYSILITSLDGETIAYGEDNGAVHLRQGGENRGNGSVSGPVTALALSSDSTPRLAFGSSRGEIGLLYAKSTPITLSDVPKGKGSSEVQISALAFAQNNTLLVAAGQHLYKYELPRANSDARPSDLQVLDLYGHRGNITAVKVDAGHNYAVSTGLDNALMVWPLSGKPLLHLLCSKAEVKTLSASARREAGLTSTSTSTSNELCR